MNIPANQIMDSVVAAGLLNHDAKVVLLSDLERLALSNKNHTEAPAPDLVSVLRDIIANQQRTIDALLSRLT